MKPILLSTGLGVLLCAATAVLASGPPTATALGTLATNSAPATNAVAATPAVAPEQATTQPADQTPQPPPDDAATPPATPGIPAAPVVAPPTVVLTPAAPAVMVTAPELPKTVIMPNGEVGLRLNFRGVPLETVLNYMSDAAGFIINTKGTDVRGKVDVWSAQPLTKTESVKLLKQIMNDNGYTVMQDGRTLTVIRSSEAITHSIPVITGNLPDQVPKNSDIVTHIDPIRSLNAVQLVKTLETLKPSSMTMTADESANSLVMTDTQENIHHMMEIVYALDSVTSSSATIRVFPLRYADSKSLASLIKDLFPSADTQQRNGGGGLGGGFGRFFRGGGGGGNPFGGGGGDTATDSGNGHTPTAKVNAVSDDHSNSLIVTAPDSLINDIAELVKSVDTAVEDTTVVQVFHLNHSDPSEMADLLTSLFPDDTGSADATRNNPVSFGFRGFFGGGGQQNNSAANTSDRMKKLARVVAVADRRTSSLVVTASTNLMPQIETMITNLDARLDRIMTPHVIKLRFADPVDVQQNLQDLFTATTSGSSSRSSSSSSAQANPLLNRQQTILQQQNSTTTSSFSGGAGSKPLGN